MNSEQVAALLRTVGQVAGGVLATNGIGTNEMWQTIFGAALTIGLTGWTMWTNRTARIVAKAGNLSAVTAPITVSDPALAVAANKSAGGTVAVAR